jgi:hypothetical protein
MTSHWSLTGIAAGAAVILFSGFAIPAPAQPGRGRDGPPRVCAYFENANFQGRRGQAGEGQVVAWIGAAWNDRISSIECHPDCALVGSEHIDFGGARRRFPGRTPFVGPAWNDRISAVRVICRPEQGGRIH